PIEGLPAWLYGAFAERPDVRRLTIEAGNTGWSPATLQGCRGGDVETQRNYELAGRGGEPRCPVTTRRGVFQVQRQRPTLANVETWCSIPDRVAVERVGVKMPLGVVHR